MGGRVRFVTSAKSTRVASTVLAGTRGSATARRGGVACFATKVSKK